jgi:hypothetical protein
VIDPEEIIADTRRWLERAVIGLNLCPYAASVYSANRVRFCVSEARTAEELVLDLQRELCALDAKDPVDCETTLLIHPHALIEFAEYNDFLSVGDGLLIDLNLEGELQIASFHPLYQFAGSKTDDIENFTNRSPYPLLHLLREASVEAAIAGGAEAQVICDSNMRTLRDLGADGWARLWR